MEVRIRPLIEEDAKTSYHWRNNPEIFKYTGANYDHIITLEDETNWIRQVISKKNDFRCAILVDGNYVGNIYLTNIQDGKAEYQIFIGEKNYWGKGVAKIASRLIISYGFENLQLNIIWLKVKKNNKRAYGLYKALGFSIVEEDEIWFTMIMKQ